MSRPIRLFVSCSPGLAPEREMVGQAIAELPVSVGWRIKHTVGSGADDREAIAFIDRCDLYLVLLGGDFAAPMGLEWRKAMRQDKHLLAYRKDMLYSPSAQRLLRRSNEEWTIFETALELKRDVKQALAEMILDRGEHFGLRMNEVEALLRIAEAEEEDDTSSEPDRRRGAGRGGVILGRGTEV